MGKSKKTKEKLKKELSEGKAIALSVLLFVGAAVIGYYVLKFLADFFFPNLF
ncbi:MAG: hypothetical protein U5J95_02180 [Balneolaceae bacterium]|nr:hypothetical protein [Balneolaceae bacterium]